VSTFDLTKVREFNYYAPRLLKIKTEAKAIVPFNLKPIQLRLDAVCEDRLRKAGQAFLIILKARREGVSTWSEGRLFHAAATTPNCNTFIIAHNNKSLNTIYQMSQLFYDYLPDQFRPMKRYSSKRELVFENPSDKDRLTQSGMRSRIEVHTSKQSDSVRSGGYACAHFSEVAFFTDAETLMGSTIPTFANVPGAIVILESTANGRGNYFHEEWLNAKAGKSNFCPVFLSWLDFDEYRKAEDSKDEFKEIISTMDAEENMLVQKYKVDISQLHWRRHMLQYFQGDLDLFHQEYPVDDLEAFLSSGQCYFNRGKIRELSSKCMEPKFRGDITNNGLVTNPEGELKIWELPIDGAQYAIGIDVGGGIEGGDPSAMVVVKVPQSTPVIEQVAEWKGWCDPVVLAGKAINLGTYYNTAMLCPEINNHGHTTLNEIKESYWNVYRWQYFDRFGKNITSKLGWETNVATKPFLCDYTSACLNANILVIRSAELLDEMMTFIKNPNGSGEADESAYDDLVMAYMIGVFTMAHSYQSSSILKELGAFANPIADSTQPLMMARPDPASHDNYILDDLSEKRDWYRGENAWLNY
jgi:hypothetical protein